VLTITQVDFHAGARDAPLHHGLIGLWARSMSHEDVDRLIEANGNLPGELMSFVFSMMTPVNALTKYNLGLFDVMDDEKKLLNFLRMEKWLADRPDHPGEAAKQWLKDLYQDNKLVKGEFTLAGEKVNLKRITMPVLNVFAEQDHLVPPSASRVLGDHVGTKDYTQIAFRGGHIGIYVSGRAQREVPSAIHDWLAQRAGT
jgi:polyhydroxyalkanoate synthase